MRDPCVGVAVEDKTQRHSPSSRFGAYAVVFEPCSSPPLPFTDSPFGPMATYRAPPHQSRFRNCSGVWVGGVGGWMGVCVGAGWVGGEGVAVIFILERAEEYFRIGGGVVRNDGWARCYALPPAKGGGTKEEVPGKARAQGAGGGPFPLFLPFLFPRFQPLGHLLWSNSPASHFSSLRFSPCSVRQAHSPHRGTPRVRRVRPTPRARPA